MRRWFVLAELEFDAHAIDFVFGLIYEAEVDDDHNRWAGFEEAVFNSVELTGNKGLAHVIACGDGFAFEGWSLDCCDRLVSLGFGFWFSREYIRYQVGLEFRLKVVEVCRLVLFGGRPWLW